jgi:hypothetical protein
MRSTNLTLEGRTCRLASEVCTSEFFAAGVRCWMRSGHPRQVATGLSAEPTGGHIHVLESCRTETLVAISIPPRKSRRIMIITPGHVLSVRDYSRFRCIQAAYMILPRQCRFCRYSPLVAFTSCALVCILISLGGAWILQHSVISLHISWVWGRMAAGLGASAVATCLAWLLTTRIRQKHPALQKFNHELRNGLQIVSYVCSQSEPKIAAEARAAVTRISSAVAKASEQLGHQYRSTPWQSANSKQVVV